MDRHELERLAEEFDTTDQSEAIERAEPGEPVRGTPMVVTSLRIPKPVMDEVRRQAAQRDMKATQLVREWIEGRAMEGMDLEGTTVPTSALLAFVAEHAERRSA